MPFLVIGNVASGKLNLKETRFVSEDYYSSLNSFRIPQFRDVLFTVTGSYGISLLVDTEKPFCVQRHIAIIKQPFLDSCFLAKSLSSGYVHRLCDETATGIAQKTVGLQSLRRFLIPGSPLAEQRRIVAALDEYLGLVDSVEADEAALEELAAKARAKVLDLAIRGKLVEQDPADEPASELLARVHAEKLAMVERGELKPKDVAGDSVIWRGEDNSYYEKVGEDAVNRIDSISFVLPETWTWCRLGAICLPQGRRLPSGPSFNYIDIDSIDNVRHVVRSFKTLATADAPSRAVRALRSGDTVFSMVRPYLENIAYIDDNLADCIASSGFFVCSPASSDIHPTWLFNLLLSSYAIQSVNKHMRGDNSPSVRKDDMEKLLLPLPPFNEQQRICNRLATLLPELEI